MLESSRELTPEHPLSISLFMSGWRIPLHTPTIVPTWYLGERWWYHTFGVLRIPADPLLCDDMFGTHRRIGHEYITGLRQTSWLDAAPFFFATGDFDTYRSACVPLRYLLPDYIRGANSDHIGPRIDPKEFRYHIIFWSLALVVYVASFCCWTQIILSGFMILRIYWSSIHFSTH